MNEQPLMLPSVITIWQDTGFLGYKPENVAVKMPTKKLKDKQLSDAQKKKIKKYPVFVFLSNMPSAESKNVVCQRVF